MRKAVHMKQLDNFKLILNHVFAVQWLSLGEPPCNRHLRSRFVSGFAFEFKIIQALGDRLCGAANWTPEI